VEVAEVRSLGGGARVTSERREDGVTVVRFENPPVNALSGRHLALIAAEVQGALSADDVRGVVICANDADGFFSSGADINEFGGFTQESTEDPSRVFLFYEMEKHRKPVVAAVNGICFGGALELALCCSARVSTPAATFSLPELKIGLIPGYGGTQRLPRLVGLENGLRMILHSQVVPGVKAEEMGLVEAVASPEQLVDRASQVVLNIASGRMPKIVASEYSDRLPRMNEAHAVAQKFGKDVMKLSQGGKIPQFQACLDVTLYGVAHGSTEGLLKEKSVFVDLLHSPTGKSLIHAFLAQRATRKTAVPNDGVNAGECPRKAAVIGGGLMGAGIATAMIQAGIEVIVKEINPAAAEAAAKRVMKNLKSSSPPALLRVTTDFAGFADVGIVIEAALEDVKLKQDLFKTLESKTNDTCILATNTSTINIDLIAAKIPRAHQQGRVIGAHFFSPAHKMPLLEVVRTTSTSNATINSVMKLAKMIKKTPILVGNCAGFCVNRTYFPQGQVADLMSTKLGINPYIIDRALEAFGLPMGPFRLADLVGVDIVAAIGMIYGMAYADRSRSSSVANEMLKMNWRGQKSGQGYYTYDKNVRGPGKPDPNRIAQLFPSALTKDSPVSDEDIVDMILLPCVNEACRLLQEGVALKPGDVDIGSMMGMAFPSFRGGLLFWATNERGGAGAVVKRLEHFYRMTDGFPLFKPSFALVRTAMANMPIGVNPTPHREFGNHDDVVVVAGYRTGMGRALRGGFKDTPIDDMLAPLIQKCLETTGVEPDAVGDLVVGTVLGRGDSAVVQSRVSSFLGGLPEHVPCKVVNRLCSSGLQSIADAVAAIKNGHYDIVLAGGAESMSLNPFINDELQPNPKAVGNIATCYMTMGQTSENVTAKYGLSREQQDRLAVVSHARASVSQLSGKQKDEIVPVATTVKLKDASGKEIKKEVVVDRDEGVRVGVSMQSLGKLKPVFKENGSTTAGNSSQISDGAALVLLMKRSEAKRRGLKPMGTFKAFAVAGVDPSIMGIGPVAAIPKVLDKAGLTTEEIDLWEINEAFGSQADYSIEKLGLNRDIVNVNGGAIAIGHPLGTTGARLTVSALNELKRRQGRFAVVSMCIGSGMGAAAVYEINMDEKNGKL